MTIITTDEEHKCLYFITLPAMEMKMSDTDRECTEIVTRDLTIPYENGFFTLYLCETHYMKMLIWSARRDKSDIEGLN